MKETKPVKIIEVRNESDRILWASACQSKTNGRLYVHIATEKEQLHGRIKKILPDDYDMLLVSEVEY